MKQTERIREVLESYLRFRKSVAPNPLQDVGRGTRSEEVSAALRDLEKIERVLEAADMMCDFFEVETVTDDEIGAKWRVATFDSEVDLKGPLAAVKDAYDDLKRVKGEKK